MKQLIKKLILWFRNEYELDSNQLKKIDILDFTRKNRYWGHNFQLISKLDKEGYLWKIAIWYPGYIKNKTIILLGLSHTDVRSAIIEEIHPCINPEDMYIATINMKGSLKLLENLLAMGRINENRNR